MGIIFSTLKKILFWSYERGSWEYDVMCVLILAFVFFAPGSWFHSQVTSGAGEVVARPIYVTREEMGQLDNGRTLEQQIQEYLSEKFKHEMGNSRIEPVADERGGIKAYLVWQQ